MIRFITITVILFSTVILNFVSCSGQNKTKESIPKTNGIQKTIVKTNILTEDPYFVRTMDTVSVFGPQNITRNILQDKKGNFWFATWEGIIRYDGTYFTNFTLKYGLKQFHVFSILEDKVGNIWFGTIRGGVYRYHYPADTLFGKPFKHYTNEDGLASNLVSCMLEDASGNIWFGTDEGVSKYNPSIENSGTNAFTTFTTEEGLLSNSINSILQDRSGKFWIGSQSGLNCYDPSAVFKSNGKLFTNFKDENGLCFSNVRSIIQDKKGSIWIGSQDGLHRYNSAELFKIGGEPLTKFKSNFIGYVYEDKIGNIWLSEAESNGYNMSLTKCDFSANVVSDKTFTKITSGPQIFGILEDNMGSIWFGTIKGVGKYEAGNEFSGGSFTYFLKP